MGFGPLRVTNGDRVAPSGGFPAHPNSYMEIISHVLDGALDHRDSLCKGSVIRPGDVQRGSARRSNSSCGVQRLETEPVHFPEIWISPERKGLAPGCGQTTFSGADKRGKLHVIGSRNGRHGSVTIHQDVDLYATTLASSDEVSRDIAAGRGDWVQVAAPSLSIARP